MIYLPLLAGIRIPYLQRETAREATLRSTCPAHDKEDRGGRLRGRLLLCPSLNMAGVEDEYFRPGMERFEMAPGQGRGLTKMTGMFAGMTAGLETIPGTGEVRNDDLNPYTREPGENPPAFLAVGEHDFLKIGTLGYGVKLHKARAETRMVLYRGFGHAFFDNTGIYPQCEDCIDEMGKFILERCGEWTYEDKK